MKLTKNELIQIREDAGISQVQMALILSYSHLHYHRIERGIYPVPGNLADILKPSVKKYLSERIHFLSDQIEMAKKAIERIEQVC